MLHDDRDRFISILESGTELSGISQPILEKDYYVCLLLSELSARQDAAPAYFKGGTALYKMLSSEMRFSEDIDLSVPLNAGLSGNQQKKRLETVALKL